MAATENPGATSIEIKPSLLSFPNFGDEKIPLPKLQTLKVKPDPEMKPGIEISISPKSEKNLKHQVDEFSQEENNQHLKIFEDHWAELTRCVKLTMDSKLICRACDMEIKDKPAFKRSKRMRGHLFSHLSLRPFLCGLCNKSYCCPKTHFKRFHPSEERPKYVPLRSELAREATKRIKDCYLDVFLQAPETKPKPCRKTTNARRKEKLNSSSMKNESNVKQELKFYPELSDSEKSKALLVAFHYRRLLFAAANQLKIHHGNARRVPCAKCPNGGRMGFESYTIDLIMHTQGHLLSKAYKCYMCQKQVVNVSMHSRAIHKGEPFDLTDQYLIRPEMADDAVANFYECHPELSWFKWLTDEDLDKLGVTDYLQRVDRYSPLGGVELKEAEHLAFKYKLLVYAVSAQIRKLASQGEKPKCAKCPPEDNSLGCFAPKKLWIHAITHSDFKLYRCPGCEVLTSFLPQHLKAHHPEADAPKREWRLIRPELAAKAIEFLFSCFPEYSWISELEETTNDPQGILADARAESYHAEHRSELCGMDRNARRRERRIQERIRRLKTDIAALYQDPKLEVDSKEMSESLELKMLLPKLDDIKSLKTEKKDERDLLSVEEDVSPRKFITKARKTLSLLGKRLYPTDTEPTIHIKSEGAQEHRPWLIDPPKSEAQETVKTSEFWDWALEKGEKLKKDLESGARPPGCANCDQIDAWGKVKKRSAFKFVVHSLTHLRSKPYACNICGYHLKSMRNHIESAHGQLFKWILPKICLRPEVVADAYIAFRQSFPDAALKTETGEVATKIDADPALAKTV